MMARAILAFLTLPAMVAGVVPWLISRIPGSRFQQSRWYGAVLVGIGGIVLIASVVSFYRRGRGTLAPWDPPKHLVVQDLYRFSRNPMYVGVEMVVLGWAVCSGNLWNYAYGLLLPVVFHLRVVLYEEPELKRLFGGEWDAYRTAVPRWGVRFRPYGSRTKSGRVTNEKRNDSV